MIEKPDDSSLTTTVQDSTHFSSCQFQEFLFHGVCKLWLQLINLCNLIRHLPTFWCYRFIRRKSRFGLYLFVMQKSTYLPEIKRKIFINVGRYNNSKMWKSLCKSIKLRNSYKCIILHIFTSFNTSDITNLTCEIVNCTTRLPENVRIIWSTAKHSSAHTLCHSTVHLLIK